MKTDTFSIWSKLKLRHKFMAVAGLFTALLAGLIVFNAFTVYGQKELSVIADVAGRQRMLAQRFTREVMLAAQGVAADHEGTARLMRETVAVLQEGGLAVINAETGQRGHIGGAMGAELRAKLSEEATLIRALETESLRYLALAPTDSRRGEKLKDLLVAQSALSETADQVVKLFGREIEGHINSAIWLQIIVGLLAGGSGAAVSWMISRQIADPLEACAAHAYQIAKGNLRLEQLPVTSADELGVLQEAFNEMLTGLREMALQSRQVCENLTLSAAQILASTQEQAAGTKQQAAAVQEITTTVEEINQSSKQVAERARQVAGTAEAVAHSGVEGLQVVRDAALGMEAIREQAETVAENIIGLSERTQAVGEIIATVNEIAEQSNLVALNAAIEAADARESGRRFAVVANEIKNLADQAKDATSQVRAILEQTQKGINTSVMLTEEALKRVEAGREKTAQSEAVIHQMTDNIEESAQAFQQIVGATNQQQIGLEQVTQALLEIRQASVQNAQTTQQMEKASQELARLGEQLAKTLEKYRL